MSKLKEALSAGGFVVTSEVGPPKGINIDECLEEAECLKDRVTAFNVTDLQSSVMRFGSLATCRLLVERGMEPILQMTCRDRNRLALQSDLLSAYGLGVRNVLCLTGDHQKLGDHPQAKEVFDLDSVQLLAAVKTLEAGKDMAGNDLDGSPQFFPGAVVTPGADPLEPQILKMEKKIQAGAQFFQTQAVYDTEKFKTFVKEVSGLNVPILAGLVILKSVGMARYLNANIAGVNVPEKLIEELKKDKEKTKSGQTGVEIAIRIINEIRDYCQGIHLMALGWEDKIPAILDGAGL
ncbi:MAG: methylenetetrahydrofolate reductase [Planctomycetota bacterium]|jgi:5,10-methylenetetrahydrofolate reductase